MRTRRTGGTPGGLGLRVKIAGSLALVVVTEAILLVGVAGPTVAHCNGCLSHRSAGWTDVVAQVQFPRVVLC